jgi:hypothetical protein
MEDITFKKKIDMNEKEFQDLAISIKSFL